MAETKGLGIQIRVEGWEAAEAALGDYTATIRERMEKRALMAALAYERTLKHYISGPGTRSRIGKQTGYTVRSFKTVRIPGGAATGTRVPWAPIHDQGGTIPAGTVIRPRVAKALRFRVGGQTVFAKKVTLPAIRIPRRPILEPPLRLAQPAIDKIFDGLFDEANRELKKANRVVARRDAKLNAALRAAQRRGSTATMPRHLGL